MNEKHVVPNGKPIGRLPRVPGIEVVSQRPPRWRERLASYLLGPSIERATQARVQELFSSRDISPTSSLFPLDVSGDNDKTEGAGGVDRWSRLTKIHQQYKGEAKYGNAIGASVVSFNRAFQFAQGLIVLGEPSEKLSEEELSEDVAIVEDFLDLNNLNEGFGLDLAGEGEMSGQVAMQWEYDRKIKNVRLRVVPLLETKYTAVYDPQNFTNFLGLKYTPKDGQGEVSIKAEDVVFIRFRGTINGTYGVPSLMPCFEEVEDFDKAKADLRKANHLYAFPTPVFSVRGASRVNGLNELLMSLNWKIGKSIVLELEETLMYAEISGDGSEQLRAEMTMLIQVISATTGVPVHFLGHPELLSNRSTSNDMFEAPVKRAQADQQVWLGGFEQLLFKVLPLIRRGLELGDHRLDPHAIALAFPPIRTGNIKDIIAAWLPVRASKNITLKTFLGKIGIANPDKEISALAEEEDNQAEGPIDDEETDEAILKSLEEAAALERGELTEVGA